MDGQEKKQVIVTQDGSSSIFLPGLDEHYHSKWGALQESKHVFIQAGFEFIAKKFDQVEVLEVGLGTGLNALLTGNMAVEKVKSTTYTALEPYPISLAMAAELAFPGIEKEELKAIHAVRVDDEISINDYFKFKVLRTQVEDIDFENEFNLTYFDAFAPRVQPELWTEDLFAKMFKALKPGGALVTYCAKGDVRRAMQAVGFDMERLPGPAGKREMLRANKP